MLRSNIELIGEENIEIREIISSGGASNSEIWNQIKADILGKPVMTVKNQDSGCLGAAILAGTAIGIYESIDKACKLIIKKGKGYYPNKKNVGIYNKYYQIYKELYERLEPLFDISAKIINNND